jgi:hypothetical protein
MERRGAMVVEAELKAPSARIQLVRYDFAEPPDSKLHSDGQFRIELCLTSRHRSARALRSLERASLRADRCTLSGAAHR